MALNKVIDYFKEYNLDNRIIVLSDSSKTVKEAAKALNCEEKMIAKSLTFLIDDDPILIVLSGDMKIDNSKYKSYFNTKAKMISSELVQDLIGHEVGGVCPFACKNDVKIYLDNSLKRFDVVYPTAGSFNSAIKLTIEELEKYTSYIEWIDVSREIEHE